MIDRTTQFRQTGDCTLATFRAILKGSPIEPAAACYEACRGMSALCLSQMVKESSLGTTAIAKETRNPLGLFDYGKNARVRMHHGMPFMVFDTWEDSVREWKRRMDDPNYKNGVYPQNCTLERFVYTYVGGPDCWSKKTCANGETVDSVELYLRQTIARVNDYLDDRKKEDSMAITYGRVPKPQWTNRLIPDAQNVAWDNLGPRLMRGVVYHRQVGTNWGTDGWFRMMWQTNGQKGGGQMGLTDFGVDHVSGETLWWNDHTGKAHPGISANRAGWASGPWEHGSAEGAKFVNQFGANAINRDLVSIEIAGQYADTVSRAAREQICQLSAYIADQAKVPHTQYPLNPATGVPFVYQHGDFQNHKPCCGEVVRRLIPEFVARTKEILKQHQEGETVSDQPFPSTAEDHARLFGQVTAEDGVTYRYSDDGSVSKAWLEWCRATNRYPALREVVVFGPAAASERKVFVFADGTIFEWTRARGVRRVGA